MSKVTQYNKRIKVVSMMTSLFVILIGLFLLPNFMTYSSEGENLFTIWLFGEEMGSVDSEEVAEELIVQARKELAANKDNLYMIEDMHKEIIGEESIYKKADDPDDVYKKIKNTLKAHQKETMMRAYMVKVNNTTVNLATADEVDELLTRTIAKYDEDNEYEVQTEVNEDRVMTTLTAKLTRKDIDYDILMLDAGGENVLGKDVSESELIEYLDFKDITQGILILDLQRK